MQVKKIIGIMVTFCFTMQVTAQVANPKANTATNDKAIQKTESISTQTKDGVDKVETKVKEYLGSDKSQTRSTTSSVRETSSALSITSKTAFALEAKDDSSSIDYMEWKPKNGEYRKYSQPIRIAEEGLTEIYYRAVDKAGNTEIPKVLAVLVDNTAPRVTLLPQEPLFVLDGVPFSSKNNTYSLSAEDNQSGVEKIQFSVNNEAVKVYSTPIKLEASGANTIKYSATDKSGNTSTESSLIIQVDDIKPVVEIAPSLPLLEINGKNYQKKGNVFFVNATDQGSGIKKVLVKVDAEEFKAYIEPISVESQGEHTIQAKAIDNVGNESAVVEIKFSVDLTPPVSTIQKIEMAPAAQTPQPATPSK